MYTCAPQARESSFIKDAGQVNMSINTVTRNIDRSFIAQPFPFYPNTIVCLWNSPFQIPHLLLSLCSSTVSLKNLHCPLMFVGMGSHHCHLVGRVTHLQIRHLCHAELDDVNHSRMRLLTLHAGRQHKETNNNMRGDAREDFWPAQVVGLPENVP
jgi:hypothetical protein